VQRPSACNALDTLVIHRSIAKNLLQLCAPGFLNYKVKILADKESFSLLKNIYPKEFLVKAKNSDYGTEFLDFILSIRVVNSFKEGLDFVKKYSSGHSEAILTNNNSNAEIFLNEIDAAVVYRNSSTRFTDGEEFGMGAEVGISTQKLHARGPMGLEALTSYKWVVVGDGAMRK
jgi:glutamate-5-semialdehyde dehydrogenase